jgi:hypothetical protein
MTAKPDDFLAPAKKIVWHRTSTTTLLLIPEIPFGRRAREAEALVEEVSE